jgi:hypothetical protein
VLGNAHGRQVQLQNDQVGAAKTLAVALMSLQPTAKRKINVGRRNVMSKAAALGSMFCLSARRPAFAEELADDQATLRELRELVPELRELLPQLRQRLDEEPAGNAEPAIKSMLGAEAVGSEPTYTETMRSESGSDAALNFESAVKLEDPFEAMPSERSIVTDPQVVMTLDDRIEAMARQVRETKLHTESAIGTSNVEPDRLLEGVPAVVSAAGDEVDLRTTAETKSGLSSSQQQLFDKVPVKASDAPEGDLKVPIMGALGVVALRQLVEELRVAETKESEDEQVPAKAQSHTQEQVEAGTDEIGSASKIVDSLKEGAKAAGKVAGQYRVEANRIANQYKAKLQAELQLRQIPEPESGTLDPEAESAKNAETFSKYGGFLKDANMDTESYLRSLGIGSTPEEQEEPQIMETADPEIEFSKDSHIGFNIYENYQRDVERREPISWESTESYLRSLETRESAPGQFAENSELFSGHGTRRPSHEHSAEISDSAIGTHDHHQPPERRESDFIELTGPSTNFANPRWGDQDPHWRWRTSDEKRKGIDRSEPYPANELEPVIETYDEHLRKVGIRVNKGKSDSIDMSTGSANDLLGIHDSHPSRPTHKQRRQSELTETSGPRSNLAKSLLGKDDRLPDVSRKLSDLGDRSANIDEYIDSATAFADYMKYKESKPQTDNHRQPEPETYNYDDYFNDYRGE